LGGRGGGRSVFLYVSPYHIAFDNAFGNEPYFLLCKQINLFRVFKVLCSNVNRKAFVDLHGLGTARFEMKKINNVLYFSWLN
jgi:hypothetical protein